MHPDRQYLSSDCQNIDDRYNDKQEDAYADSRPKRSDFQLWKQQIECTGIGMSYPGDQTERDGQYNGVQP